MIQEQLSSSLSRPSSETKPRKKLVLISREPLLYLEFNKPNKQNVFEINLLQKNQLFLVSKLLTHWLMPGMKHQNITSKIR